MGQSFFDIEFDRKSCSTEEYLRSVESEEERIKIQELFNWIPVVMREVESFTLVDAPPPAPIEVQIIPDGAFVSEAIHTRVTISAGLLAHCLRTPPVPIDDIVRYWPCQKPEVTVPEMGFAWILAHEAFHSNRRHNTVLESRLSTTETDSYVAELDSDMCASAVVFRIIQNIIGVHLWNVTVREIAAAHICWTLRHLPVGHETGTHPPMLERMVHCLSKLEHLAIHDGMCHLDNNPIWHAAARKYSRAIQLVPVRMERVMELRGYSNIEPYWPFRKEFQDKEQWKKFLIPWVDMASNIADVSHTGAGPVSLPEKVYK